MYPVIKTVIYDMITMTIEEKEKLRRRIRGEYKKKGVRIGLSNEMHCIRQRNYQTPIKSFYEKLKKI